MLWNSAGSLLFWGCQWLMTVFVVRLSDTYDAAGVLSLAMTVYNTFSSLAVYRMFTYQVSDVKHENTLGEYFAFRLVTFGMAFVVWVVYTATTCPPQAFMAIMLYILSRFFRSLTDVLHAADQLYGRMDYIGISNGVQGVVSLAVFCGVFYFTQSLEASFAAIAAATLGIGLVYDLPRTLRLEALDVRISFEKSKRLLLICLPIVLATIAMQAAPSIPRQFLAFTMGEGALGAYASIAAPAAVIQMGASYIYNPVLSTLSEDYLNKRVRSFVMLSAKTMVGIVVVCVVFGALLVGLGPWLLELMFGPSILEHLYLLVPVVLLTTVTGMLWFANDLLIGIRQFRGMVVGNACALLVSLALTPFLVNAFGANGISFTGIASYALGLVIMIGFFFASVRRLNGAHGE